MPQNATSPTVGACHQSLDLSIQHGPNQACIDAIVGEHVMISPSKDVYLQQVIGRLSASHLMECSA